MIPISDVTGMIASGPGMHLVSTKKTGDKLLTGIELKCVSIDYDTTDGNFFATGPGLIKLDNSQTDEPQDNLTGSACGANVTPFCETSARFHTPAKANT